MFASVISGNTGGVQQLAIVSAMASISFCTIALSIPLTTPVPSSTPKRMRPPRPFANATTVFVNFKEYFGLMLDISFIIFPK